MLPPCLGMVRALFSGGENWADSCIGPRLPAASSDWYVKVGATSTYGSIV